MATFEVLFPVIVRFNLVAFVLLGACLWMLRYLKQPLERVRLIEVALLSSALTFVLVAVDAVPKLDLALLPAFQAIDRDAAFIEPLHDQAVAHQDQSPISSSFEGESFAASSQTAEDLQMTDAKRKMDEPVTEKAAMNSFALLPSLKQALMILFLSGSLLNFVYLAVGYFLTRRLVSRAKPISKQTRARIEQIVGSFPRHSHTTTTRIASSDAIDVPMVAGCLRPTVLLPERLTHTESDDLELQHGLAHEWGHIVLHDLLTWQLAGLCQVFLWMQPGYWLIRRELRVAQDQLADQFAVEQTREQATYATTLVELSRARHRVLSGALTMAGRRSNLYRRIEMMMNENFKMSRSTRKSMLLLFAILFVATGGLMTSLRLTRAEAPAAFDSVSPTVASEEKESAAINDDKKESVEHSGQVVDADTGEPIAGVTVTITRLESLNWKELGVTDSLTDADGKYTFSIPPEQLKEKLLYILVDIDHPEYAKRHCGSYGYGMIAANLKNGEQPWFSKLTMVRGEKVSGRLVDSQAKPIAGAQIRGVCNGKTGNDMDRSSWLSAVSDSDGRFEMVVPHDSIVKLSFVPLEHCMKHVVVGGRRGDLGDFTLYPGIPLQGVVKDAEGNPMSGLWVNMVAEKDENEASYEMRRSAKTDENGRFVTRPLALGKHLIEIDTEAAGALEKEKYANFTDVPPPAMFVKQSINVTADSVKQPFVIQAVPHVTIACQFFTPSGEITTGHTPHLTGKFDGQFIWTRGGRRTGKGAFELMVPHGIEDVELRFITNEHSALKVQFQDAHPIPQTSFKFTKLEENIDNIRVVKHQAGILKLDIVDEAGKRLENAGIFANYDSSEKPSEEMMVRNQIGWNMEEGLFRLSSIVPGAPVSIRFSASGFQSQTQTCTMNEGERRTVKITLKKSEDEKATKKEN